MSNYTETRACLKGLPLIGESNQRSIVTNLTIDLYKIKLILVYSGMGISAGVAAPSPKAPIISADFPTDTCYIFLT